MKKELISIIGKFRKLKFVPAVLCLAALSVFVSCGKDTPDKPDVPDEKGDVRCTVLLYAVASNNLSGNLRDDKNEILEAACDMDLKNLRFLIYQVTNSGNPQLLELKRINSDSCAFETVKEYSLDRYSVDKRRIEEVVRDVRELGESKKYGLVLWSHGTGLDPVSNTRSAENGGRPPMLKSFGSDKNPAIAPGVYAGIDIDELADAIPDGMFDYIWFDACYMGGIETIYELRDKCNRFVGYPTEVFTPGMPYHLTLPYILAGEPDLVGGAQIFFDYYSQASSSSMRVATVVVVDMEKLENVADVCREIYAGETAIKPDDLKTIRRYTRGSIGPFHDLGQYTTFKAAANERHDLAEEFGKRLEEVVLFKATTNVDFNYNPVSEEDFSGLSCYLFNPDEASAKGDFYRTLDWYVRVYRDAVE